MKKLVINLERRSDRKDLFIENNKSLTDYEFLEAVDGKEIYYNDLFNMGLDTDKSWRDPFHNRKLTHGEIGCLLSHFRAWARVAEQEEPMMILEDDAIVLENYDEQYYESLTEDYDLIYLQRNENQPEQVAVIDDVIETPSYPYNLTAYILTPEGAKALVGTNILQNIIPADEYVPRMINQIKTCALKEDVFIQIHRNELKSDIEPYSEEDWFIDFNVYPITVGTDRKQLCDMMTSANSHGIYPINIGNNIKWEGTDMTGYGGGHKLNLIKEYLNKLEDHEVVLFTDGYDVLYNDNLDSITRRYIGYNKKVIFSAERDCWPDESLESQFPESNTPYRYLNSGTFIGEVGELRKILSEEIANEDDDQLYCQKVFLKNKYNIALDYENYIFNCNEEDVTIMDNGQYYNPHTNCCPSIYHGNGGESAKGKLNELKYDVPLIYLPNYNKIDIIDKDMFIIDFMSQAHCEYLIEEADKHGGWGSLSYDKFPAQEIRMKEIGLWEELEKHWQKHLYPVIEKFWKPIEMYGLRDAFVMRYSTDTQTKLNLHTDASMVTGSVKLNDDYVGGELVFPRQDISNKDIPVGKAIIFPGQVTHGHASTELTEGIKYSLTMWSSRYPGDIL